MTATNSSPIKKMLELFLSCLLLSTISKYGYITVWKNDLPYFSVFCQNKTNIKELVEGMERDVCYVSPKGYFFLTKKKQRLRNTGRGRCV